MNLFGPDANVDDVDLEDLDATKMHPSAKRYFFMRERTVDTYDVTKRHPCFFGCDYQREDSR
jgi:translation elongation factor P/translation initiation factor 5A